MIIKLICIYWRCVNQTAKEFLSNIGSHGYDGVEINLHDNANFVSQFIDELSNFRNTMKKDFIFIAQQVAAGKNEPVDESNHRISDRPVFLTTLNPDYINSHKGKNFFDFHDNCKIIEITAPISLTCGIPVWHKIHWGCFSFHLKTLSDYKVVSKDFRN
jgi:hypothetical protein